MSILSLGDPRIAPLKLVSVRDRGGLYLDNYHRVLYAGQLVKTPVREFDSLEKFARYCNLFTTGYLVKWAPGFRHDVPLQTLLREDDRGYGYILTDRFGDVIALPILRAALDKDLDKLRRRRTKSRAKRFRFRDGPVHGIHHYHAGPWGGSRGCTTFNEIRTSQDEIGDGWRIQTRAKRKNLPSVWDDRARSSYGDRNWKRYRRHQCKAMAEDGRAGPRQQNQDFWD